MVQGCSRWALLTAAEMRAAEERAVAQGPLSFYDLMQAAGRAVAQAAQDRFAPCRVLVACGPGNNGGDGYVAARALREAGWSVRVAALAAPGTDDARRAAQAWRAAGGGEALDLTPDLLTQTDLVIDALFGTGLTRPLEGGAAAFLRALEECHLPVMAADIPSGIDSDTGRVLGVAAQAQTTVTFFRKKRGHVLMPGLAKCGEVLVVPTGMAEDVLREETCLTLENARELWFDRVPHPSREAHKYDRGHALIFGGPAMTGATRLAARAAQRIGAGLVTLASPRAAWEVYSRALESVIVLPVETLDEAGALLADPKRHVLLIGPGLGLAASGRALVLAALASGKPCVLDADALTLFADAPDVFFEALHEHCVLTPHEGEFLRLFGARIDPAADKLSRSREAAALTGACVLLKGADTVVANPQGWVAVNVNAPPWLATGGAGDVLAGMILGLLAGGMPPFEAACAAAYAHSELAAAHGPGLIAEDLVAGIPGLLRDEGCLAPRNF